MSQRLLRLHSYVIRVPCLSPVTQSFTEVHQIVKFMGTLAEQLPLQPPDAKDAAENSLSIIMSALSALTHHKITFCRRKCLGILRAIVHGLKFEQDVQLGQDMLDQLEENLLPLVQDKDAQCRLLVVQILEKLVYVPDVRAWVFAWVRAHARVYVYA